MGLRVEFIYDRFIATYCSPTIIIIDQLKSLKINKNEKGKRYIYTV